MHKRNQANIPQVEPRLLTVKAAALYLSVAVWFIRTLVWQKRVPFLRMGKRIVFDRADLDRYVEQQKATQQEVPGR